MTRLKRKENKMAHKDPINFTCGLCRQVHAFDSENPYKCELVDPIENDTITGEGVDNGVQD